MFQLRGGTLISEHEVTSGGQVDMCSTDGLLSPRAHLRVTLVGYFDSTFTGDLPLCDVRNSEQLVSLRNEESNGSPRRLRLWLAQDCSGPTVTVKIFSAFWIYCQLGVAMSGDPLVLDVKVSTTSVFLVFSCVIPYQHVSFSAVRCSYS